MFAIYQIRNLITQEKYIGFTASIDPNKRWKNHIRNAKKGNTDYHIYRAMRKYGIENFAFEILEVGENNGYGLKIAEPMYIESLKPEYNMTSGGEGIWDYKFTDEQNRVNSLRQKGIPKPPRTAEHCSNIAKSKVGIPRSEECNQRVSESRRIQGSPWNRGRIFSKEHREKLSIAAKNRKHHAGNDTIT